MRIKSTCGCYSETQQYVSVYVQLVDWSIGSNTRGKLRERRCPARLRLCSPYAADELRQTDIVRVELINAHAHRERCHAQRPGQDRSERGELAFVDVIHQDGIEPDMTMDDEADAEQAVDEGSVRAGCDECGCCERDETGREQAFEGPVV